MDPENHKKRDSHTFGRPAGSAAACHLQIPTHQLQATLKRLEISYSRTAYACRHATAWHALRPAAPRGSECQHAGIASTAVHFELN